MLIAGDIGGTKTDLAIYSSKSGPHAPLAETEVHSADYPSLQAICCDCKKTECGKHVHGPDSVRES